MRARATHRTQHQRSRRLARWPPPCRPLRSREHTARSRHRSRRAAAAVAGRSSRETRHERGNHPVPARRQRPHYRPRRRARSSGRPSASPVDAPTRLASSRPRDRAAVARACRDRRRLPRAVQGHDRRPPASPRPVPGPSGSQGTRRTGTPPSPSSPPADSPASTPPLLPRLPTPAPACNWPPTSIALFRTTSAPGSATTWRPGSATYGSATALPRMKTRQPSPPTPSCWPIPSRGADI